MKKKLVSLMLVMAMSATAFTACGGNSQSASDNDYEDDFDDEDEKDEEDQDDVEEAESEEAPMFVNVNVYELPNVETYEYIGSNIAVVAEEGATQLKFASITGEEIYLGDDDYPVPETFDSYVVGGDIGYAEIVIGVENGEETDYYYCTVSGNTVRQNWHQTLKSGATITQILGDGKVVVATENEGTKEFGVMNFAKLDFDNRSYTSDYAMIVRKPGKTNGAYLCLNIYSEGLDGYSFYADIPTSLSEGIWDKSEAIKYNDDYVRILGGINTEGWVIADIQDAETKDWTARGIFNVETNEFVEYDSVENDKNFGSWNSYNEPNVTKNKVGVIGTVAAVCVYDDPAELDGDHNHRLVDLYTGEPLNDEVYKDINPSSHTYDGIVYWLVNYTDGTWGYVDSEGKDLGSKFDDAAELCVSEKGDFGLVIENGELKAKCVNEAGELVDADVVTGELPEASGVNYVGYHGYKEIYELQGGDTIRFITLVP